MRGWARVTMGNLKERFERFVKTLNGFESIDVLLSGNDPKDVKRADYFFLKRSIIVEQKTIERDPSNKPQEFVESLVKQGKIMIWGTVSTKVIFDKLPDGEKLKAQMFDRLTRQIDTYVSDADKQTRDTRKYFDVPDALGILVLLNENGATLTPDVIRYGVQRPFAKKLVDGSYRYPHNQGVIVLSELHPIKTGNGGQMMPILPMFKSEDKRQKQFDAFTQEFMTLWAQFNRVPLVHSSNFEALYGNYGIKKPT